MAVSKVFAKAEAELCTEFLEEAEKMAKQHNFILDQVLLKVFKEYDVEVTYNDTRPHILKGQWNLLTKVHEKLYDIILDYDVINLAFEKNILLQNTDTNKYGAKTRAPGEALQELGKHNNIYETLSVSRFTNSEAVSSRATSESELVCSTNEFPAIPSTTKSNQSRDIETHIGSQVNVAMPTNTRLPENTDICDRNNILNIPHTQPTTQPIIDNFSTRSIAANDIICIKQEYTHSFENDQPSKLVTNVQHCNKDFDRNIVPGKIPMNQTANNPPLTISKTETEKTSTGLKVTKRKRKTSMVNVHIKGDSEEEEYKPCTRSAKSINPGKGQPQKDKLQVRIKKVHSKTTKKKRVPKGKTVRCECCDFAASCRALLVQHKLKTHLAKTTLCTLCKKPFPNAINMHIHRLTHYRRKIYRCGICNKEYKSLNLFENHEKTHVIDESKLSVTCKLCLKEYSDKTGLNDHIISSHYKRESDVLNCNICEREFSKWKAHQHIASHRQIVLYLCDVCGDLFVKRSDLCEHLKSHENLQQPSRAAVTDNTKTFTKDNTQNSKSDIKPLVKHGHGRHIYNNKELGHPCKTCGEVFQTKWKMKTHMLNKHTEKPSKCDLCSKSFSNSKYMKRHRNWVHMKPKIKCDICGQVFTSLTMRGHIKTHQSDYKAPKYSCDMCGKSYTCKHALQMHIKRIHEGYTEQHLCNICGKIFASQGNLRIHTKLHSDERPHVCHICGAAYKESGSLKIHLCSHQDKGQYKCTYCDRYFKYKCSLRGHTKIHEGRYDHVCDICGKKFRQKNCLKNHLRIHSGEKPFFCKICGMRFRFMCVLRVHLQGKHKIKKEAYIWQEDIGKCS